MPESHIPVQVTADGLIALRADDSLMKRVGASDPFAVWFLTEEGRGLAEFASRSDPVYTIFNLVRYRWFSERLADAAGRYSQIVVLGAGYDTRPFHMGAFRNGGAKVFEVDVPATLKTKRRVLEANGVEIPDWVVQVPCDIGIDDIDDRLRERGFVPDEPCFVMAEGLFYYLDAEAIRELISRSRLHLAARSVVGFDFWDDARTNRLNDRVFEKRGIRLFKQFPLPQEADDLRAVLMDLGYENVQVISLDSVARKHWPAPHDWTEGDGWMLVEAVVR